jgi:hypothetical protein
MLSDIFKSLFVLCLIVGYISVYGWLLTVSNVLFWRLILTCVMGAGACYFLAVVTED